MLEYVEVRTRQGLALTLPLEDPTGGYYLDQIDGLDPVKATLVSSSFAQMDGAQYHSSRREPRNIKLKVTLSPDSATESIRELRQKLYNAFMPKAAVSLRFHLLTGTGVLDYQDLDISGRVESCESALFSGEPVVDISMMCFDPDFVNPSRDTILGKTTPTLTEFVVPYSGTVETGLDFALQVDRSVSAFTVYHRPPDGTLRTMDFSLPLVAGDILKIGTVPGAKNVTLTRANVERSALYALSPQSNWLELQQGVNYFRVYAEGAPIPFTMNYTTRYGGL